MWEAPVSPGPASAFRQYGAPPNYEPTSGAAEKVRTPTRAESIRLVCRWPGQRVGLIEKIAGGTLPRDDLLEDTVWDVDGARQRAFALLHARSETDTTPLILVGSRVCDAFSIPRDREWLEWFRSMQSRSTMIAVPAPVSAWWADPDNYARASDVIRKLVTKKLPLGPWSGQEETS
jgi:hypothetical protein